MAYHGVEPLRTHDLLTLVRSLPAVAGAAWDHDELAALAPYAVEVRYSDDVSFLTAAHADRALAAAEAVWARVNDAIGAL